MPIYGRSVTPIHSVPSHALELVKRYLDRSRAHVRAIVLKEEQDSGFSACPTDAALTSLPLSSSITPTLVTSTMAYNKRKRAQAQIDNPGVTTFPPFLSHMPITDCLL